MWTHANIRSVYLSEDSIDAPDGSISRFGERIDNAVRLLRAADLTTGPLRDMGESLKKWPTLTDKQRSFAKALILKDSGCVGFLAEALEELNLEGHDVYHRVDPSVPPEAMDDKVEVIHHKAKSPNSEKAKEPEPEVDLVKSPLWGMF